MRTCLIKTSLVSASAKLHIFWILISRTENSDGDDNDNDDDNVNNDEDETMRDEDNDNDNDDDNDDDNADDNPDDNDDNDDENQDDKPDENADDRDDPASQAPQSGAAVDTTTSIDAMADGWPQVRKEALEASTYDIVPTIAAPQSTSINAITATSDMRYVFTGGADGYIRKFNWADTVNAKLMLTVAQRHPFVDSVVKAGVLMTYWENWAQEQGMGLSKPSGPLSPVHSLASQRQALWLLSGLENGGIRLQSVRHEEGKEIVMLKKHTSAVSVLNLVRDEQTLLSGSWDKYVHDWDMNTGLVRRSFAANAGQISAIEIRPESSLGVPSDVAYAAAANGNYSSNILENGNAGRLNGATDASHDVSATGQGSPTDSLFGGGDGDADSLFGDNDLGNDVSAPSGGEFHIDQDDEFSKVLANGIGADAEGDVAMSNTDLPTTAQDEPKVDGSATEAGESAVPASSIVAGTNVNGLPHSDFDATTAPAPLLDSADAEATKYHSSSDSTFLAASIDGTIRIWDRRQSAAVAKIVPRNTPPWCMSACWSPDGNFIYAGRRNGTVEEYSLHKGFREPERVFRFPQGSGIVSVVKAMPNKRHLIWYVLYSLVVPSSLPQTDMSPFSASHDILRLYDLQDTRTTSRSAVPFLIVPGHRTGVISQLFVDPTCKYLISTGGNRGWEGSSTEVLLGYEIGTG